MQTKFIEIPEYTFDKTSNPYSYDSFQKAKLDTISNKIESAISKNIEFSQILVRGIQSGRHTDFSRNQLIETIKKKRPR